MRPDSEYTVIIMNGSDSEQEEASEFVPKEKINKFEKIERLREDCSICQSE